MKRRVLVAQALVHKPPVIVLDEPTAGVDVELRQALWQFIRRLNRDGHTVVLTTHYLEEAEALCGRIAMLKQGRVVALDSTAQPADARRRPAPAAASGPRRSRRRLPRARSRSDGEQPRPALESYAQVESVLAQLRAGGLRDRGDGAGAARPGRRVRGDDAEAVDERVSARCSTRRCCASGR